MRTWAHLAALAAFGSASAARVRRSFSKFNEGYTVELANYFNIQYYGNFTVGEQTLPVMYDTGSFEVLVLSNLCGDCASLMMYHNDKSSSFNASDVEYEHNFGSGLVRSRKGFETLRIGNSQSPYSVQHFPFWQVMKHEISAWNNKNARFAGIVGLGHSDIVPKGYGEDDVNATTLLNATSVDSFAICLQRGEETLLPGRLILGARKLLEDAPFAALQVKAKSHWSVPMTDLHAEGTMEDGAHCRPSCGAIVDSGTSLIAAPPAAIDFVTELKEMVKDDCSNMEELPVLRFKLDGTDVELPPAAWVMRVKQDNVVVCKATFMAIDKDSDLGPVWILGMPFLRYYLTVFDRDADQIHITRSTPNCEPEVKNEVASKEMGALSAVLGFTALDYKPLDVDLAQAMTPAWAQGKGRLDL